MTNDRFSGHTIYLGPLRHGTHSASDIPHRRATQYVYGTTHRTRRDPSPSPPLPRPRRCDRETPSREERRCVEPRREEADEKTRDTKPDKRDRRMAGVLSANLSRGRWQFVCMAKQPAPDRAEWVGRRGDSDIVRMPWAECLGTTVVAAMGLWIRCQGHILGYGVRIPVLPRQFSSLTSLGHVSSVGSSYFAVMIHWWTNS